MIKDALVSIVLPTHNGASGYLETAIHSCLSQTYSNFELIIVDDGSTDKTPLQIERFAMDDSRIRTVRHERNRRLPASLNSGLARACGDYLTWTSDDNCYRPHALEEMVGDLQRHSEIDIVYSDYTAIDRLGRPLQRVEIWEPELLLRGNAVGPCFLFRRRVYEEIGEYDEDLFLAEDYDYWLRASVKFRLHPLHFDLYEYRRHSESLTAQNQTHISKASEVALRRNLPKLRWASSTDRAKAYYRLALTARSRHDMRAELSHMLMAARHSPGFVFSRVVRGLARAVIRR